MPSSDIVTGAKRMDQIEYKCGRLIRIGYIIFGDLEFDNSKKEKKKLCVKFAIRWKRGISFHENFSHIRI